METINYMLTGFTVALAAENLLFCAMGVFLGTIVGALPGLGPAGATAILLPATFKLNPVAGLIMLAGIYYGTQYGGTITAVLMNIPGESASVVTMIEGHVLAKKGKAGLALGIAAIGSFIGGTVSVVGLMIMGPYLANMALVFGPAEYFSLMVLALSLISAFTGRSLVRGLMATAFGLILSLVGRDVMTGEPRLTFGLQGLFDGIDFLPVSVGMFGISETIESFERRQTMEIIKADLRWHKILPSIRDLRESVYPILRGSIVGFFAGILPGAGATIASFLSYGIEHRVSKRPEQFGHGALAGIAGPETANNASTGGAMIPMMSLGIPGSPTTAILLGAFFMFGLKPGPSLYRDSPEIVWGLIASMYIGNVMLVVINIGFIPFIVKCMDRVRNYMPLLILLLAVFGVYSYRNSVFDVAIMLIFGLVGYVMGKLDFPQAPVILALLLGNMAESSLLQAMVISNGTLSILVTRPLSATFLFLTMCSLILPSIAFRKRIQ